MHMTCFTKGDQSASKQQLQMHCKASQELPKGCARRLSKQERDAARFWFIAPATDDDLAKGGMLTTATGNKIDWHCNERDTKHARCKMHKLLEVRLSTTLVGTTRHGAARIQAQGIERRHHVSCLRKSGINSSAKPAAAAMAGELPVPVEILAQAARGLESPATVSPTG